MGIAVLAGSASTLGQRISPEFAATAYVSIEEKHSTENGKQ
jgi:hypothetical protein